MRWKVTKTDKPKTAPVLNERLHFLDEVRGFLVVLMIFYHGFYTAGYVYNFRIGRTLFHFFEPVEPLFAGAFIVLCGFCCHLSRNNLKRGSLLLLVSLLLTGFTLLFFEPGDYIWFGILHLLAVCILLFCLLQRCFRHVPPLVGLLVCAFLAAFTWNLPNYAGYFLGFPHFLRWDLPVAWQDCRWLCPLGIGDVPAGDYFPLIPWVFVFFGGSFLGELCRRRQFPFWWKPSRLPALSFVGRHALLLYILHQPVIYGLLFLVEKL